MMPLTIRRRLARLTATMLCGGWSIAWATVAVIQESHPDLLGLPWTQIAVGVLVATWGGITATLGRYLASQYAGSVFLWRAELARDSAVSVTVGAAAYMGGAWYQLGPMVLGLVLLLAGYAGVRILSSAADRLLEMISSTRDPRTKD